MRAANFFCTSLAGALSIGHSRTTLIATKTFSLPFFHKPSTLSPYLALSPPIVATAIYAVTATADGCIAHYQLITAAPRRVASRRIWEKYRNETKQKGTIPSLYMLRKTRVYIDALAHTRETHCGSITLALPASLTWRRLQKSSQINSFPRSFKCCLRMFTWKKFFVEISTKFR